MTSEPAVDPRAGPLDDVYSSGDLSGRLPRVGFPRTQRDPRHVFASVRDELMLDGNSRQNLATFCQTWVDDGVHQLMDASIDKNMIDKDEYPQTAEIEERCVHMLADLWNSPDAQRHHRLLDHRLRAKRHARRAGAEMALAQASACRRLPVDQPNLVCGPVQICWHKFARYFDVELREIPLEGPRDCIMRPSRSLKRVRREHDRRRSRPLASPSPASTSR